MTVKTTLEPGRLAQAEIRESQEIALVGVEDAERIDDQVTCHELLDLGQRHAGELGPRRQDGQGGSAPARLQGGTRERQVRVLAAFDLGPRVVGPDRGRCQVADQL